MLTLYIANKNYSSWSLRPWVLMRMLEIPFQERLLALLPMREWMQSAKDEPWRDAAHDEDSLRSGTLLRDLRVQPR